MSLWMLTVVDCVYCPNQIDFLREWGTNVSRNYGKQGDWLFEFGTHSLERPHLLNTPTFQVLLSTKLSDFVHWIYGSNLHHNVQFPINVFLLSVITSGGDSSIIC